MQKIKLLLAFVPIFSLLACANQRMSIDRLPKGVVINKAVQLPNTTVVRYYLPQNEQQSRFFSNGYWIEPGKGLVEGSKTAFNAYFPQAKPVDLDSNENYGVLIDLQPSWDLKNGTLIGKMGFKAFIEKSKVAKITGEKEFSITYEGPSSFYNVAMRTTQMVLIDVLNQLEPTDEKFPAKNKSSDVDKKALANMEKPITLGTGFFFNANGQLLTANHVLDECLVIRIQSDGKEQDATLNANSALLDLAVLDTDTKTENYLLFRKAQDIVLGEMVSSIGYPLQGLLAETPNLTRGNISAKSGMKGSLGQFQFSAPIQPGTSGGPIISEAGEILGTAVSTLNSKYLIEKGILPQNVNFGLDSKYIVQFLRKHKLQFSESKIDASKNFSTSNNAALAASVRVACYQ
jgi:serine protease Do